MPTESTTIEAGNLTALIEGRPNGTGTEAFAVSTMNGVTMIEAMFEGVTYGVPLEHYMDVFRAMHRDRTRAIAVAQAGRN